MIMNQDMLFQEIEKELTKYLKFDILLNVVPR